MARLLSIVSLLSICIPAFALTSEESAAADQGSMVGMIGFGVLFIALCVGFVWMVIRNEKKQKGEQPKK